VSKGRPAGKKHRHGREDDAGRSIAMNLARDPARRPGRQRNYFGSIAFGLRQTNSQKGVCMKGHPARLSLLASLCASMAVIAMPNADAASKFDGTWSAVFRTKSGPCQPAYRGAVQVVDGIMEVAAAGGSLSGRVLSNGSVKATGYMGANYGAASGRVSGNSGGGTWRARMESGSCAGVWTAQRR
jgi:hypothetical protein